MKIVVIESREAPAGDRLVVIVPGQDLWALQVLCARAGQQIIKVSEESDLVKERAR